MIADVWSKRDFVVRGVALVGLILVVGGQFLASSPLTGIGLVVLLVAFGILIGWRLMRGRDPRRDIDPRV